jgi:hypothetical protein
MPKGSSAEKRKVGRDKFAHTEAEQSSHLYNVREKLRPQEQQRPVYQDYGEDIEIEERNESSDDDEVEDDTYVCADHEGIVGAIHGGVGARGRGAGSSRRGFGAGANGVRADVEIEEVDVDAGDNEEVNPEGAVGVPPDDDDDAGGNVPPIVVNFLPEIRVPVYPLVRGPVDYYSEGIAETLKNKRSENPYDQQRTASDYRFWSPFQHDYYTAVILNRKNH